MAKLKCLLLTKMHTLDLKRRLYFKGQTNTDIYLLHLAFSIVSAFP